LANIQEGDTIFFQADTRHNVVTRLGMLRNKFIADLQLLEGKQHEISFSFVVDFPLFEMNDEGKL